MENIEKEISKLESERINNTHWADLTLEELRLIEDKAKKREYKIHIDELHMTFINNCAMLVGKDFKFSVPNEILTYRIMANDYMNYFYNKGMTKEEIIEMISNNKGKKR